MSKDANMVYTAIHFDKEDKDIDKLSARVEDGIVTYKGEMDLEEKIKNGKVSISYIVMEHDKEGNFVLSEKERQIINDKISKEEIDKKIEEISKQYLPSEELYKSVQKNRKNILVEWLRMLKIESEIAMKIGTNNLAEIIKRKLEKSSLKEENINDRLGLKSQVYTDEELAKQNFTDENIRETKEKNRDEYSI